MNIPASNMTSLERRAVLSLSSVMALRMIGLFMVVPVFSLYAQQLKGATPTLIGIALGVYGLSQALFQIPFGVLSDRFGRKPLILTGLIFFILGSFIAGTANSMFFMVIGRTLQGMGAIGSTILATISDLTRENQRTKSMAIAGITIGLSFALSMILGPIFTQWLPIHYLFYIACGFGCMAILILYTIPTSKHSAWQRDTEPELNSLITLLWHPELLKLNLGIFILHAIFTASFVVIPISLLQFTHLTAHEQWMYYLPSLLLAFTLCMIGISRAEKNQQIKFYFLSGIFMLIVAQILLWAMSLHAFFAFIGLCFFFTGFSLLEAFLPSLISRTAPAGRKGSAMGIYSSSQFLGIFLGGLGGGWLYGHSGLTGVYLFCIALTCIWLGLAFFMKPAHHLVTQHLPIHPEEWQTLAAKLQIIPGIKEVTFIAEDAMAYLKLEPSSLTHPEFIRLKEQYSK